MNKEEYDKYKKVVDELDGYDICDEFNLGTYELKDKKKLLEIVLMYYFKNQDELQEKDQEIKKLNKEKSILEKSLKLIWKKDIKIDYEELDKANKVVEKILKEGK